MRLHFLLLLGILATPPSAHPQETIAQGLKGSIHTVLTEDIRFQDGKPDEKLGSDYQIFDKHGYTIESFLYKPDGSLWSHAIMTRIGDQLLKTQVFGTAPFDNHSEENHFDSKGRTIETDDYDGGGFLRKKTVWSFTDDDAAHTSTMRWKETGPDGVERSGEQIDVTDPKTGTTHVVTMVNGERSSYWTIERDEDGGDRNDKIVLADGSYNSRERGADGTTVEDRFQASTNSHEYQKTDAKGRLIEVTGGSGENQVRSTYSYDDKGRPTGQINYDASGKIMDKGEVEYVEDAFGNWIEKKSISWHSSSDDATTKTVSVTRRYISYY